MLNVSSQSSGVYVIFFRAACFAMIYAIFSNTSRISMSKAGAFHVTVLHGSLKGGEVLVNITTEFVTIRSL